MLKTLPFSAASIQAQAPDRRPNFLIIYTDDQGIGDVGCYGAKDVKTPNIDRLAERGARFTNWYSSSPVCSPSRASVLTGKYPQRTGVVDVLDSSAKFDIDGLRANETTVASLLRRAGYRTGAVGKWHLGSAPQSRPMSQGFDEFFGFYSGWTDYYSHRYYKLATGTDITHDLWRN
ncbi:MAG TPA: sulfatase-like hydrolase/transferase, partial [Bryobacteraceae bacterium]|nr:sulfatase-like hydrolase/transferase [Bryobacteraceae bacterium]